MNAYLAEVVKKQSAKDVQAERRTFALRLIDAGKETLEEIANLTGLALAEVKRLSHIRE